MAPSRMITEAVNASQPGQAILDGQVVRSTQTVEENDTSQDKQQDNDGRRCNGFQGPGSGG